LFLYAVAAMAAAEATQNESLRLTATPDHPRYSDVSKTSIFPRSADACVSRVRKSRLKHVGCGRNASPGALAVLKNFGRAADGGAGLKRDKQQARSDADHAFRSGPQSRMQHPGR
jgi:hypothetical protein